MINMSEASNENKVERTEKDIEKQMMSNVRDWDVTDSYRFFRNYVTDNPIAEYIAKKKCVEFGKELMPMNLEDKEEQRKVDTIYSESCITLVQARPSKRSVKLTFKDFGGDRILTIYTMTSTDANEAQAREEEFEKVLKNFVEQQYEGCIGKLQEADNKIFHIIIKYRIIPIVTMTPEKITDTVLRKGGFDVLFEEDIPNPDENPDKKLRQQKEMEAIVRHEDSSIIPPGITDEEIFEDENEDEENVEKEENKDGN